MVMLSILIIITCLALTGYLAFSKRLSQSSDWKAMVTPLASIMGSGFLVSAPLLGGLVGSMALPCMALLLLLAYGVGSAIRFNIEYFEPIENERGLAQSMAFLSRIVLAAAYFISVTYYLQLLAAFILHATGVDHPIAAPIITTSLLCLIGGIGMWKGLDMLEGLEKYAISINLGMIGSLILGLIIYNVNLLLGGDWKLPNVSSEVNFDDLRVLLGLLIVVQGFETSRYLGANHPSKQRIQTMRRAQILSGIIYLSFIALTTVLFHDGIGADVTAIITMTAPVAIVLPVLLSIAAIGSQFSAAVADNEGAGGLIQDISHGKTTAKHAYLLILICTVILTWETNVNEIIAYASRSFALFYMLQCMTALITAHNTHKLDHRNTKLALFAILTLLCFFVFALGIPSE